MNNRPIKLNFWDKTIKKYCKGSGLFLLRPDGCVLSIGGDGDGWGTTIERPDVISLQFTGLQDKNGRDIYEGDLIQFNNIIGVVVFREGYFNLKGKFQPNYHQDVYYLLCNCLSIETDDESTIQPELIGNIFENHDLIK